MLYPNHLRTFRIFNIRTGEKQLLDSSNDNLTRILITLLRNKYEEANEMDDEQFINACNNIKVKYC